jgi:hypothetical protein
MPDLKTTLTIFVMALAVAVCGGDSLGPESDADADGIVDADDPTPNGSSDNRLNGTNTGGSASAVEMGWYDSNGTVDTAYVYGADLTIACDDSWEPQGTLCDEAPTTHDPDVSTKTDYDSGATWYGDGLAYGSGTGVLVVDACSDGTCVEVDVNEARIFQMYSDGKTTHVRFFVHPDRGSVPPPWDDAGWQALGDFNVVDAGVDVNADGLTVSSPTVVSLTPSVSRYFRMDVRNDGRHESGDTYYIELRSVKLFSVALP